MRRHTYRILVVDDNDDIASTLALILEFEGHTVRTARSGLAAISVARHFQPELAILDIGMPTMDGYELAQRLRDLAGAARPVLLAVTGWGGEGDRHRALDAGFDYHLIKPVDPGELLAVIGEISIHRTSTQKKALPVSDCPACLDERSQDERSHK
jgi:DNA-binding response OmpR family regulator